MKVGVISEGDGLDSFVAEDFGHAPFFLIVDSETMDYTVVRNEFADSPEGAGMKVAEAIASLGVDAVITGGIGSHGIHILEKAGIRVSYDEEGTAEECIEALKRRIARDR
jgi:predicted Fe-Mo cluster-binding NifX family protein